MQSISNQKKILSGPRNLKDGLWDLHIPSTSNAASNQSTLHQANAIIMKDKSKTELAQYLHAAAGYPVLNTFIQAIKRATSFHGQVSNQYCSKNIYQNQWQQQKAIYT